ncbi:UPF0104 family protein [Rudanella paleaurantiibacter]|uniref:UPF0104 family protein n=2 Tax=Rudanella paleaurantiibacter TaxID=2614655 RepID=A0A7J5U2W7_9BACT|nr:UPF0104 family protein [Rudanella paleaurantiibacter]
MKQMLTRGLFIGVALALLVYALKDISFSEIVGQFRQAHYGWVVASGLVVVLIYWVRAMRWQQSLLALHHHPTVFRAMVAYQTGAFISMLVVGSGELTRCITLQRTDQVPVSHGLGSVVAERVLDFLMLLLVLLLTFVLESARMIRYFSGMTWSVSGSKLFLLLGLSLVTSVGLIWLWRSPFVRKHPFSVKLEGFAKGLWSGFAAIRQLPNPWLFVALTILTQVLSWLHLYLLMLSVESTRDLPPTAALTVLAVASIGGLAVPTQGGVGTFHFFVGRILVLYGLSTAQGTVVATFLHTMGLAINLVLNSLSFLIVPVLIAQAKREKMTVPE